MVERAAVVGCHSSCEMWELGSREGCYTYPPDRMLQVAFQMKVDSPVEDGVEAFERLLETVSLLLFFA